MSFFFAKLRQIGEIFNGFSRDTKINIINDFLLAMTNEVRGSVWQPFLDFFVFFCVFFFLGNSRAVGQKRGELRFGLSFVIFTELFFFHFPPLHPFFFSLSFSTECNLNFTVSLYHREYTPTFFFIYLLFFRVVLECFFPLGTLECLTFFQNQSSPLFFILVFIQFLICLFVSFLYSLRFIFFFSLAGFRQSEFFFFWLQVFAATYVFHYFVFLFDSQFSFLSFPFRFTRSNTIIIFALLITLLTRVLFAQVFLKEFL